MKLPSFTSRVTQRHKTVLQAALEDAINQQALAANISSQQLKDTKPMDNFQSTPSPAATTESTPRVFKKGDFQQRIRPDAIVSWVEPPQWTSGKPVTCLEEHFFYAVLANPGITGVQLNAIADRDVSPFLYRLLKAGLVRRREVAVQGNRPTYAWEVVRKRFSIEKMRAMRYGYRPEKPKSRRAVQAKATSVSPSPQPRAQAQAKPAQVDVQGLMDSLTLAQAKALYAALAEYFGDK